MATKKTVYYDGIPEIAGTIASQTGMTMQEVYDAYTWCRGNSMPVTYRNNTTIQDAAVGRNLFISDKDDINEYGPRRHATTMIITAYPGMEYGDVVPLFEEGIEYLDECAEAADVDLTDAYITPLVKHTVPGKEIKTVPMDWMRGSAPFLYREVKLIQPDYVIAVGMHVLKFFFGSQATLDKYYGRLHDFTFMYSDGTEHKVKLLLLPAISKNAEARDEARPRMMSQLRVFSGNTLPPPQHVVTDDPEVLKQKVDEAIVNNENIVAIDLEWEGEYPGQSGAHVITFQFSTKPGKAVAVVLGNDNKEQLLAQLKRLLTPHDAWVPRIGGHFLRADMPWVLSLFKDDPTAQQQIKEGYFPASSWEEQKTKGGWDTALMYHAYKEDAKSYGLKPLAETVLGIPKWDSELEDYKANYLKENGLKQSDLKGYGCIPIGILGRYGCWDADATRRLAEVLMVDNESSDPPKKSLLTEGDVYRLQTWEAFWRAHAATPALLEMETEGLGIDLERLIALATTFSQVYDILLSDFRQRIHWDTFNPASSRDKQGFLFGREYTKSVTKAGTKYSMPEEAISMKLTPIYTTGDKKDWDKLDMDDEDWDTYMPAADAMTLSILAQEHPLVRMLYDICKLGNTLRSNIRPPVYDEDNNISFDAGIYTYLHEDDNKVHTNLRQLLKTGRLSSSAPNLQNISKSAEENIQRILGMNVEGQPTGDYMDILLEPRYLYPMRTIITADPDWYFLESDFTGAELAVMAWISGDPTMIEHVRRNALPESDPNFYDMHSHMAVAAFHLPCEPTKKGLKSIGKKHLRVAAKAVVFGIPLYYQAGVKLCELLEYPNGTTSSQAA